MFGKSVRAGKLFAGRVEASGAVKEQELADFNAARPETKPAPSWARRW